MRSPLLNLASACQTCHRVGEDELKSRVEIIQDRNRALLDRSQDAVMGLLNALVDAKASGATEEQLKAPRELQRKAQWRLDYISAENSMGFHASQEAARILAESIDYARQGELQAKSITPTRTPQRAGATAAVAPAN